MCGLSVRGNFIQLIMVGMWAVFAVGSVGGGAVDGFRRKWLFAVFKASSHGARVVSVLAVMLGLSFGVFIVGVRAMRWALVVGR